MLKGFLYRIQNFLAMNNRKANKFNQLWKAFARAIYFRVHKYLHSSMEIIKFQAERKHLYLSASVYVKTLNEVTAKGQYLHYLLHHLSIFSLTPLLQPPSNIIRLSEFCIELNNTKENKNEILQSHNKKNTTCHKILKDLNFCQVKP